MQEATQDQIEAWKRQYGKVFMISVKDENGNKKVAYLKKPDRKTIAFVSAIGTKDPIKFNETLLKNCWIDGDMEIQTDDDLFLSISQHLSGIIQVKEAELVKL